MKRFQAALIIVIVLLLGGSVLGVTWRLAGGFLTSKTIAEVKPTCNSSGTKHVVTIKNERAQPAHVSARICDRLTIINRDQKVRDIAFGRHERHISYDGVSLRTLTPGQQLTVELKEPGNFLFHDHRDEAVGGEFSVQ